MLIIVSDYNYNWGDLQQVYWDDASTYPEKHVWHVIFGTTHDDQQKHVTVRI